MIEARGIIVEVCPIPDGVKERLPRGRPAFSPEPDLDDTLRAMWKDPIRYTAAYVVKYASEKYGKPVTRNQLNHRYGNRYEKEPKT